jgi:hypothetical protein
MSAKVAQTFISSHLRLKKAFKVNCRKKALLMFPERQTKTPANYVAGVF